MSGSDAAADSSHVTTKYEDQIKILFYISAAMLFQRKK
jgi:hypothetical protein